MAATAKETSLQLWYGLTRTPACWRSKLRSLRLPECPTIALPFALKSGGRSAGLFSQPICLSTAVQSMQVLIELELELEPVPAPSLPVPALPESALSVAPLRLTALVSTNPVGKSSNLHIASSL